MRIAVLSDIHGNLPALTAVLAEIKPYDQIWQLGDIVGYGPQPNEVVELLISENALGVRGNHDAAAIGALATEAFNDDARAAVEWTADQLSPTTRAWLTGLPLRTELAPEPRLEGFTLVHGSPRDPTWEYVYTPAIARANMNRFATTNCLVGHTHVPVIYWQTGGRVQGSLPPHGTKLPLTAHKSMINPGSVGQPRDGDPRASALMLDTDQMTVEWLRVEYPIEPVQELMTQAGLPDRLIARLRYGLCAPTTRERRKAVAARTQAR